MSGRGRCAYPPTALGRHSTRTGRPVPRSAAPAPPESGRAGEPVSRPPCVPVRRPGPSAPGLGQRHSSGTGSRSRPVDCGPARTRRTASVDRIACSASSSYGAASHSAPAALLGGAGWVVPPYVKIGFGADGSHPPARTPGRVPARTPGGGRRPRAWLRPGAPAGGPRAGGAHTAAHSPGISPGQGPLELHQGVHSPHPPGHRALEPSAHRGSQHRGRHWAPPAATQPARWQA